MIQSKLPRPGMKHLLSIAFPMIVSQMAETVMMFVDRLFLSRLGKYHLSAAMSGGLSTFVFCSLFIGMIGYVNAVSAQYYGAGKRENSVRAEIQALYLSVLSYGPALLLIPVVGALLGAMGHAPEQLALEMIYFRTLMAAAILMFFRNALAGFFLGIGQTRVVMIANVAGMLVNIPLNYVLIFGKLGLPAMGIRGAALGTIGGALLTCLILAVAFFTHPFYREVKNNPEEPSVWQFRRPIMRRLIRYGAPAGVELFLNVFAFNFFLQLMHSLGPDVAAAVTITFSYDMVAFIPMLGLGFAVTSLTGQYMGAGRPDDVRRTAFLATKAGYTYAAVMIAGFVFAAGPLVRVFSGDAVADSEFLALAKTMVRMAAIYTLADVTQVIFGGVLRGAGDTRWLMLVSTTLHWMMAAGAFILVKKMQAGPVSIWIFFIGFIVILGMAVLARFLFGSWRNIRMVDDDAAA